MKTYISLIALFLFFVSIIACSEDEMTSVCGENGIPVSGTDECFCNLYYEGQFCENEIREKFIGKWVGYNHGCRFGDTLSDGFIVEILKTTDVTTVEIRSENLFNADTIISNVDFLGFIRHEEYKIYGNQIFRTYAFDIYHDENPERLRVFVSRNEDLDEWVENCNFILRRE
jgi:hypothetical protein